MKARRCGEKGRITTSVASKKRKGMHAKKLMATKQAPEPKCGQPKGREELDMMDALLNISSRLQAMEAHIATLQEIEDQPYGRNRAADKCQTWSQWRFPELSFLCRRHCYFSGHWQCC